MQCPRDNSELIPESHAGTDSFQCGRCGGIWIDYSNLLETVTDGRGAPPRSAPDAPARDAPIYCPIGKHKLLVRQTLHNMEIDTCPEHLGFWFDGGELESLLSKWTATMEQDKSLTPQELVEMIIGHRRTGSTKGWLDKLRDVFTAWALANAENPHHHHHHHHHHSD